MAKSAPHSRPADSALTRDLPLLDDADGCKSAGSRAQLGALRRLLRAELLTDAPQLRGEAEPRAAAAILHRWTSACAFCGAQRLRDRVECWRRGLSSGTPAIRPADFDRVLLATCRAIEQSDGR